jgi:hypothetical protein
MRRLLLTTALAGAALFATSAARAQNYQLNGWNYGTGENVEIGTSPDLTNTAVYAGQIVLSLTPLPSGNAFPLPTWCTDVYNWQQSSGVYTLQDPLTWNGNSDTLTALQDGEIGWLMNNYATSNSQTGQLGAATQLAIWQTEYGAANFTLVNTYGDDVNVQNVATTLETASVAANNPNLFSGGTVFGLVPYPNGSGNQTQSFLYTPNGGGGDITQSPEPASMTLLGAGLAGLAALRRRKARR